MTAMTTRNVFTYGSLMFPEVWSLVVVGEQRSIAARLADHARFAVAAQDYPGMVHAPGEAVAGVLYCDVDATDLARLDHFEGDDYRRETVSVVSDDGACIVAETYVYLLADRLLPTPWDPQAFAMERFIATYCRERLAP